MAIVRSVGILGTERSRGWIVSICLLPVMAYLLLERGHVVPFEAVSLYLSESARDLAGGFGPLGQNMAGPLLQIILPSLFTVYYIRKAVPAGIQLALFWLGQNFLHLSFNLSLLLSSPPHGPAVLLGQPVLSGFEPLFGFLFLASGLLCFLVLLVLPAYSER